MLLDGQVAGVDQRHGAEIVAPADLGLGAFFQCAQQLGHRSDKGVREPDFVPARLEPVAGPVAGGEVQGAGRAVRVVRPADGAAGQALASFDAPTDADIGLGALAGRPRPDVVPSGGAQLAVVLQDVQTDPVAVLELPRRARIGAHAGKHAARIAEQVTERVQMMDRHDPQRDPALPLLPGHPVRDGAHVDAGENRLAQQPSLQQALACADRLVVTHVLIHGQHDPGRLAHLDDLGRLGVIHPQRLLRQNAADVIVPVDDLPDHVELSVRRHGDVEDLHLAVFQHPLVAVVNGQPMPLRHRASVFRIAGRDRHGVEARLAIGDQVAVGHDEPGPDATDRGTLVDRQSRQVVQVQGDFRSFGHDRAASTSSRRVVSSWSCCRNRCVAVVGFAPVSLIAESGNFTSGV